MIAVAQTNPKAMDIVIMPSKKTEVRATELTENTERVNEYHLFEVSPSRLLRMQKMIIRISLFIMASLLLNISPARATDTVYAPSIKAKKLSVHSHTAKKNLPTTPLTNDSNVSGLKNTLTVDSQIELFRTFIKDTSQNKGTISQVFSSKYNPIDIELLAEMRRFINLYAGLPQTDEVFHLMALVHKRTKNYSAAALDWELLKVMYPQSAFVATANKQLQELNVDQLSKQAAVIERMNTQIAMLSGDMDQRTGQFIEFLRASRDANFAAAIVAEAASFLARNKTFQNEDVIESAIAHQSMLIDNDIALYRFNKLLSLYPASNLRADSLLSIACIQRENLKLFDKASKTYLEIIKEYPDSNEAKLGYEELATMYNVDMHDYPNALGTYEIIITKYKKDPSVLYSLLSMEKIYENKTFQLDKAIASYLRVADIYDREQDGLNALVAAESIAFNSTSNWSLEMSINDRIVARAPNSEVAIKATFSNAEIVEEKLGDKDKAKVMYESFIAEHPAHALAKEAQKRIDAMSKKS